MSEESPSSILERAFQRAFVRAEKSVIRDADTAAKVEFVARYLNNRAGVRLLLACTLAKIHDPDVDIRKPYTELGDHSYSGRFYDEAYVTDFINRHDLPL